MAVEEIVLVVCFMFLWNSLGLACLQVEVDFEDKETYEFLFKEYWLGLKNRLSLSMPELDKDGKPANENHADSESGGSDTENQDPSDVDELGTESERAVEESDEDGDETLDGRKWKRKKIKVAPTFGDLVVVNQADTFMEGGEHKEEEENEDKKEEEEDDNDDNYDDDDDDDVADVSDIPSRKIEGWASKEVLDFIIHMKGDPMKPLTRIAVNRLLWSYIKQHQLQDPGMKIICDERLQVIFGKKLMGQSEMYRQLKEHFPPKESVSAAKSSKEADRIVKDEAREADGAEDKLDRATAKDKRRGRRRSDEKFERPDGNDFAAITPKNINLIYLRRSLLEDLLDDPEFDSKVVDTFVKIRVPGNASTLDTCYRLVLITGNGQAQRGELQEFFFIVLLVECPYFDHFGYIIVSQLSGYLLWGLLLRRVHDGCLVSQCRDTTADRVL
jgi:chromatin remodeling complex protein RSC6